MIIAGAGGHAKEVALVLVRNGESDLIFFDETVGRAPDLFLGKWRVVSSLDEFSSGNKQDLRFILGIGKPSLRARFFQNFQAAGLIPAGAIDPSAIIGATAKIGPCINAMPFCFISEETSLGEGCLINSHAHVHHNTRLGKFCEVSPGASVLGSVRVGDYCQLGAHSVILPKVAIGKNVIIGAGAVVIQDLPDNCVAVGVPAKIIEQLPPLEI